MGLFIFDSVAAGPPARPALVRRVVGQALLIVDTYMIVHPLGGRDDDYRRGEDLPPIFVQHDNICQSWLVLRREHG